MSGEGGRSPHWSLNPEMLAQPSRLPWKPLGLARLLLQPGNDAMGGDLDHGDDLPQAIDVTCLEGLAWAQRTSGT